MNEYQNIKTPAELLKYMDNIQYGFTDKEGKNYGSWNEEEFEKEVFNKWFLSSPERLIKVKHGHCYDQVELERDWFIKHGYKVHTYYMMFLLPYENPYTTHTFLIYEKDNKYYYFEHSDYYHRGIYEFKSLNEALTFCRSNHLKSNKAQNNMTTEEMSSLKIFSYPKPKYNLKMNEFIDYILDNGQEIDLSSYWIEQYIKDKISNGDYTLLPDTLAIGKVYKIHKLGDLNKEGYEVGYLYLPKSSGIKEHKHTNDIERYKLISGVLRVFNFPSTNNICPLNHVHCIDPVPEDTIIETCKISKTYLNKLSTPIESTTFDNLTNKTL